MTTEPAVRTNYILVDYENVQELDLDLISGKPVVVFLVVGHARKALPTTLVKQIQRYHDQVKLIDSEGAGKNALDLVLAYHVGQQAKADPKGYFTVVAKDKDYDPLIKHLRANSILASRDDEFARIPALLQVARLSLDERVKWVVERFQKNKASRPSRKKTLLSTIHSHFRKELSDEQVEQIISAMIARGFIEVPAEGKIVYHL